MAIGLLTSVGVYEVGTQDLLRPLNENCRHAKLSCAVFYILSQFWVLNFLPTFISERLWKHKHAIRIK